MRRENPAKKNNINLMKECITRAKTKKEIMKLFSEKTMFNKSTVYDYYNLVVEGYDRFEKKRIANISFRNNLKKKCCYLCGDINQIRAHHIDYLRNKAVGLCDSCHNKVHTLFKKYHKAIKEKDILLIKVRNIIDVINKLHKELPNLPKNANDDCERAEKYVKKKED